MDLRVLAPQAAAVSWWLSGAISAADCYQAHQAKGAASLAASYSNLNDPGTHDAGVGVAPDWDAGNGWKFNGTNHYLTTTFQPDNDQSQTMIAQFTNFSDPQMLAGAANAAGNIFALRPNHASGSVYYNGGVLVVAPSLTSGNTAIAGNQGYRDGVADGGAIAGYGGSCPYAVYIGCWNDAGSPTNYGAVYLQAYAIYTVTITAAQVAAVRAAMAAL